MSFVGREAELGALLERLREGAEVVTVVGAPGVGKTRLAREAWARLRAGAPQRTCCWVDATGSLGAVRGAIADALGAGARPLGEALARVEAPLLFLDGLAPELGGALLPELSPATVVVTARARTGVPEEHVVALGPLADADAVRLLVETARRHHHAFATEERDAPMLAELARELGGHPLALEVAGARLPILGARALLHRTRSHVPLAPGSALDGALGAALDALEPHERAVLGVATVFRSFDLAAAEAVLSDAARPAVVADVLVRLEERALLASDGAGRFRWLAPVRAIAAASVSADALAAARERRAAHYAREAELASREGTHALRRWVVASRDELVDVLEDVARQPAVGAAHATPALHVLAALAFVLPGDVPLQSVGALVDPVLEATKRSGADVGLMVRALASRGLLRRRRGEAKEGARDLVDALGRLRALAPTEVLRRLEVEILLELGAALFEAGDGGEALAQVERALELARALGDRHAEGRCVAAQARLFRQRLDPAEASVLFERAAALHAADALARGADLVGLAEVHVDCGRAEPARAALEEAARCAREAASPRLEAEVILVRGFLALDEDDGALAKELFSEAAARHAALGDARREARANLGLGITTRAEGRPAEAYALLASVRDAHADAETRALACGWLAALDADVGRSAGARAALDEVRASVPRTALAGAAGALDALAAGIAPSASAADDARALAGVSAWVRLALRPPRVPVVAPAPLPAGALVVGEGGTWLRLPSGERIGLETRRSMALLLDRLAAARAASPGVPVPSAELQGAGWPGERMLAAAGAHRVRVAIATLRKLGLRDLLVTSPAGYLLSADVPFTRVAGR